MSLSVQVKFSGAKRYGQKMKRAGDRKVRKAIKKNLRVAAKVVQKKAKKNIGGRLSGPDKRRRDGSNQLGSWSGALRRSVRVLKTRVKSRTDFSVQIAPYKAPEAIYGNIFSGGFGVWKRRPWLMPALYSSRSEIKKILQRTFKGI